jgi:integrase
MAATTSNVLEIPKKRGKYGEGSIYQPKDNGRWEISFYDNEGRRRRQSFSTESKARKALNRVLTLKEAGKLDEPETRVKVDTLAEAYLRYLKNSKPKSHLWATRTWKKHLEPFFGGRMAGRVGTSELDQYIEQRKQGLTDETEIRSRNATINRELAILKAAYNHGAYLEPPLISRVPKFPKKLRESDPRSGWVSDEQYEKLQDNAKHVWLRGFLAVAFNFGFRKSELLGLRVKQVNLKDRTIQLLPGTTKNDKGRTVRMTEDVYQRLSPCVKEKQPEDAVFTWGNGDSVKDFRVAWDKMCKAAKVDIDPHDFRRTAVRNLVRSGVSEKVAMRISGHVTRSVFDRYDISSEDDLVDAAEKLENRRKAANTAPGNMQIGRKLVTEKETSAKLSVTR